MRMTKIARRLGQGYSRVIEPSLLPTGLAGSMWPSWWMIVIIIVIIIPSIIEMMTIMIRDVPIPILFCQLY